MTLTEMKRKKQELGYSNQQIAELSGVPFATVQKIFSGTTKRPRYATLQALARVFEGTEQDNTGRPASGASAVQEETFSYGTYKTKKKQGEYTLDDYYALPDDYRAELIDGVIYDMTAPGSKHQIIISRLHIALANHIDANNGSCIPIISPTDVQLDCDDKTMVQPDLLVLCDHSKMKEFGIFGAPDFVIEVLSPSTRRKDLGIKFTKYERAGVREYWIIDPEQEKVLVYDFSQEVYPVIYGFTDKIPVGIFNGRCVIDFEKIRKYLHSIFDSTAETQNRL